MVFRLFFSVFFFFSGDFWQFMALFYSVLNVNERNSTSRSLIQESFCVTDSLSQRGRWFMSHY